MQKCILPQLCFAMLLIAVPTPLNARTHQVSPGINTISMALSEVATGDTLVLSNQGVYHETRSLQLPPLRLTILSESLSEEGRPVWTTDGTRMAKVYGDFTVKGIVFDGRGRTKNGIRSYAERPNNILVEDCLFENFSQDAITDDDVPVGSLTVRKSVFRHIRKVALEFRTDDMCYELSVIDCTFYDMGEHAIHVAEDSVPLRVSIENVTISDANGGIYLNNVSKASIGWSIIVNCRVYGIRSPLPVSLTNICTFSNAKDYDQYSSGKGCFNADPHFYDGVLGDFSLLPGSPCLASGRQTRDLGDSRWAGEASIRAGRLLAAQEWGELIGLLAILLASTSAVYLAARRLTRRQEEGKFRKRLAARVIEASEEEKRRLSMDLHDQLGQDLVSLGIHLDILMHQLDEEIRPLFDELKGGLSQAITSVRRIAYELRPAALDELGLEASVTELAQNFASRTGVEVRLSLDAFTHVSDSRWDIALYRIVQEALTNVGKHAKASVVSVQTSAVGDNLITTVSDDGTGFDMRQKREIGLGLENMRERVDGLGGRLDIQAVPGGGTQISVYLPLGKD